MLIRVDWRSSCSLTGLVLKWLAVPLGAPLALAFVDGTDPLPFLVTIAVTVVLGVGLEALTDHHEIGQREAFLMVALTWLGVALVGAIPFLLAGNGVLARPVNAVFESTSGVTTTGATVIADFDAHPRSIMLWRAILQWLGGLGILIVAIGLFSHLLVGGAQLMETESQTQNVRKLRPHLDETARLIWGLYVGLTVVTTLLLLALSWIGIAPEMDPFNAVAHALTSVSTAGFSPQPDSIGAFSPAVQWTLIPVMILGATNFVLLYAISRGEFRRPLESDEFRFYLGLLASVTAIVVVTLALDPDLAMGLEPTVRHGLFNVVSMVTTTGYASANFDLWSPGAKHMLFLCMFTGGMAGSTTCSIKSLRWLVIGKTFRRNLFTAVHPDAVRPVRLDDAVIDEETVGDVFTYVMLVVVIFFLLTVVIVVDSARVGNPVDEFDALGAAASIFLNIGPAFGVAGPFDNYLAFSPFTRTVMIVMMWVGRIEIIPVLVLLTPTFWKS
ncbi:TrkH family potassium uptake protein [Natrinema salsiterrestre]|uniref:TrkH family potassium uptake protein n=1 Tax=Natrinema salsiterrestre TaxID=2950540 RepID=A0A9Q4L4U2_9EURY|nr:TrkH family potassium uptake protein [Natrinema salsiterrestre]MDF9747334.1 TrkH family potassium uptake protein [Natrinema salsiterrestre]